MQWQLQNTLKRVTQLSVSVVQHFLLIQTMHLQKNISVISFIIKGGRPAAAKFMDSLKLASNEVHVADIRTCVLHPASETHRQLSDEQLVAAGIDAGMVRFSVGLENIDDILEDLDAALKAAME